MVWATVIKQSSIQVALKINKSTVTIIIKYDAIEMLVFNHMNTITIDHKITDTLVVHQIYNTSFTLSIVRYYFSRRRMG